MQSAGESSAIPSTVSLSEASRLLSKPENTIREWIKTQKLQAHRDSRGRWLIHRHDLMAFVVTKGSAEGRLGATSNSSSKVRAHEQGTTESSNGRYVRSLEDSLDRERRINDELRAKIAVMEQERTQHLAEMRALLSKDQSQNEGIISRWIRR